MIPAVIVLLAIACALGGYITFDVVYGKKKNASDSGELSSAAAELPKIFEEEPAIDQAEITVTDEASDEEELTQVTPVTESGKTRYIVIRYSRSFLAKLIQSEEQTKSYYSQVKNRILSYDGVKSRISWKWESFRLGRKTLAKMRLRGKTLSLCLALNPEDYADTKYKVEKLEAKSYADTPCMYRIKNDRRLKYGEELIAALMAQLGVAEKPIEEVDYVKNNPYENTEALIERKLIKKLTTEELAPTIQPKAEITVTDENSDEEVLTQVTPVTENGKTRYIVIRYSRSFLAKLIQSEEQTKSYYSRIKNRILSYGGVKSRISWKWESFRLGRKTLAKMRLRGKTLSLCLALNPEDYADTKYKAEKLEAKSYADTPCMYRIKNDRRLKYGEELIAALMAQLGVAEKPIEEVDYVKNNPYETTEALIECKLIKKLTDEDAQSGTAFKPSEVRESVSAQEVDKLMQDDVAATLIKKTGGKSDKTKTGIVNIDTLSQHFKSGEVVTLYEIKKRLKGFNKQTTYIKVLARGTLDKPLTVEADSFSLQAVKMIVLTGGTAIKR